VCRHRHRHRHRHRYKGAAHITHMHSHTHLGGLLLRQDGQLFANSHGKVHLGAPLPPAPCGDWREEERESASARSCVCVCLCQLRAASAKTPRLLSPPHTRSLRPDALEADGRRMNRLPEASAEGGLGSSFALGGTPRLGSRSSGFRLLAAADSGRSAPRAHPQILRPEPALENVTGSCASGAAAPAAWRRRRRVCS
jgi:hypothetical protein